MGILIGSIIAGIVLLFAAIVLIRALLFVPKEEPKEEAEKLTIDADLALNDLSEMIKCKTISYYGSERIDIKEFDKFRELLVTLYPQIHKTCTRERIGNTGLLYRWKGKEEKEPVVLMAHYDVVPIKAEQWDVDAFAGLIKDDVLWGRGTLDTKGTLCGVLEAAELLIADGFVPKQDVYFSFSGDEEIFGTSAPAIVSELQKRGIRPAMVLDEGGAIVSNVFPGVATPAALIGIAEKGAVNFDLTLLTNGGHASTPPRHTGVGRLAQAGVRIESNPMKRQLTKPVLEMFDILGRHSGFAYKILFANLWCFAPLFDMVCKKAGGELNAMMRTTCALTTMSGSDAYNVLPFKTTLGGNARLIGTDTIESFTSEIEKLIDDEEIEITIGEGSENPSPCSETDCEVWKILQKSIRMTWKDTIVSPYLMMAGSDSRHYCRISDNVYRFSAMELSKEERGMIHGNNERIPKETLKKTVEFYVRLLKQLSV